MRRGEPIVHLRGARTIAIDLKRCFLDPELEVMNFLNEVAGRYPAAISFAPGRPAESLFDVEGSLERIARFVAWRAEQRGAPTAAVYRELGQYHRTNGIICDLVARQLGRDEGIACAADDVVLTTGCQEGMVILLAALFDPDRDALLVSDPTYIGITGLARILGITLIGVSSGPEGLAPEAVAAAAAAARRAGRRPRAVYDIPDFNNPLGTQMPLSARRRLLAVARQLDLLVFEDNPYGMFSYDGPALPTLKALDEGDRVIYLGSFSKTLFPGLRLGCLVLGQEAELPGGRRARLADELSKVKSLTTVNTSSLTQAVVGGTLLDCDGSLRSLVAAKLPFYRRNRDTMLDCLTGKLGDVAPCNRPAGGFFVTVDLPFAFDDECLERCARDYGVIVCPMRYFAVEPGRERQVRLAFSAVAPAEIEEGTSRFTRFVHDRLAERAAPHPHAERGSPAVSTRPARGTPT